MNFIELFLILSIWTSWNGALYSLLECYVCLLFDNESCFGPMKLSSVTLIPDQQIICLNFVFLLESPCA